jgi:hypothetical protein
MFLGDEGVLVLAEQILQSLRFGEEPSQSLAIWRGEVGRVPDALEHDPERVDLGLIEEAAALPAGARANAVS